MRGEPLKPRLKRRLLDFIARRGYDVEKNAAGFPPYRLLKRLRLGEDPWADVDQILGRRISCVFDVGAHVGQTAARLAAAFPDAEIYSFEPDPAAYAELRQFARACSRVHTINAAMGDRDGSSTFFVNVLNQTSSLLEVAPDADKFVLASDALQLRSRITVPVLTLDRYCADSGLASIDLLKLDTQGFELHVLEGARDLLMRHAVPAIYLEVGFVRIYQDQPLFPDVYRYLYDRGYRLVWLYDRSFHTHFYSVAANALFIHVSIGSRNGSKAPAETRSPRS